MVFVVMAAVLLVAFLVWLPLPHPRLMWTSPPQVQQPVQLPPPATWTAEVDEIIPNPRSPIEGTSDV